MSYYEPDDHPYDRSARREGYDGGEGEYPDVSRPGGGAAGARVTAPAIAIIVTAALNVLCSIFLLFLGVTVGAAPPDKFEEALAKQNPQALKQLKEQGLSVKDILNIYIFGGFGGGGIGLLVSALTIFGAVRMLTLKSYGLSVFVSILTAIPCISPSACCGIGIGIGVWSLVVLMSADVRAAFR